MTLDAASDGSLSQSGETSASTTTADDAAAGGGGAGAGGDGGDAADSAVGDGKPHIALRNAVETLEVVLSGYAVRAVGGQGGKEEGGQEVKTSQQRRTTCIETVASIHAHAQSRTLSYGPEGERTRPE